MQQLKEEREWRERRDQADRHYRDQQRREDQEYRDQQRREDLEWKQKLETAAERRHKWELWVGAFIVGMILAAAQLWGSWMQVSATREAADKQIEAAKQKSSP